MIWSSLDEGKALQKNKDKKRRDLYEKVGLCVTRGLYFGSCRWTTNPCISNCARDRESSWWKESL